MAGIPAGFESDFDSNSDYETELFKKPQKTNIESEDIPQVIRKKIPWDKINEESNLVNTYYLDKVDSNETDTGLALFEENLKRMIIQDDFEGIKLLIEDGLELDFTFKYKFTLLSFSVFKHKINIVELLLQLGTKDTPNTISPIIALCSRKCLNKNDIADSIKVFDKLVEYDFNLQSVSNDGQNGVHFAIKHGNLHLVAALIKHGVDFRHSDKTKRTPLNLAASIGSMIGVRIISSFFTDSEVDIADLKFSSSMTHNYSIKSYIESLINDPSLIKPIDPSDNISNMEPEIPINENNRLQLFLNGVGMKHLFPVFVKNSFRFSDLFKMDAVFLQKKFKLTEEETFKLKSISNEMKVNSFDKNSFFISNKSSFNVIDICIAMNNFSEHLEFIESGVRDLSNQLQVIKLVEDSPCQQAFNDNCSQMILRHKTLSKAIKELCIIKENIKIVQPIEQDSRRSFLPISLLLKVSIVVALGFIALKRF